VTLLWHNVVIVENCVRCLERAENAELGDGGRYEGSLLMTPGVALLGVLAIVAMPIAFLFIAMILHPC
jgi:hypothetical protein